MLGSEHGITQIPWDNLFRKSRCSYLNIAGTLDPPPTLSGTTSWPLQLESLGQWSSLFSAGLAFDQHPVSEWIYTDYSTFTPVSIPVVETLKSRYANISGVGGLYNWGNFFLGKSSARKRKNLMSITDVGTWKPLLFYWFSVALRWPNLASGIWESLGFSYLTKQLMCVTPRCGLELRAPPGSINKQICIRQMYLLEGKWGA